MGHFKRSYIAVIALISLIGALIFRTYSTRKNDPSIVANNFRDAFAARDWGEIYSMASFQENEAVGWTLEGFTKAMNEAARGLRLENCKLKFLNREMPVKTAFSAYIEVPGAISDKTKYVGLQMRLSADGWKVRTYGLPSEACTLTSRNDRENARCLSFSLKAAHMRRALDPYARVQRTVDDLDRAAAGEIKFDDTLTLDLSTKQTL